MNHKALFKQMVDFNQSAFNNSFQAMVLLQDQTEKMSRQIWQQSGWLTEESKKALNEWTQAFNKGRDEYKKTMDQNFASLQKLFPAED